MIHKKILREQAWLGLACIATLFILTSLLGCAAPPTAGPSPTAAFPSQPPTPALGKGVVIGHLVSTDPAAKEGLSLFLGSLVDVGEQKGAYLDRQKAPIGRLDAATGKFIFADVPPGMYSFIVSEPERGGRAYMTASGGVKSGCSSCRR